MKAFLECTNCIVSGIIHQLNKHEPSKLRKAEILRKVLAVVSKVDLTKETPPSLTKLAQRVVIDELGIKDLYYDEKKETNKVAMELFPLAEKHYAESTDRLEAATKLAIASNLIDYGALKSFDMDDILDDYIHRPFAIDDYQLFKNELVGKKRILYVGDNAGEIVFDKILVKELISRGHEVVYVVKSTPVLNDVLIEDAIEVGMTKITKVIESGSGSAGTVLSECTDEFMDLYNGVDMIISKGQGNFETFTEEAEHKRIFYLLLSKCQHISDIAKIKRFDLILMDHRNYKKYF